VVFLWLSCAQFLAILALKGAATHTAVAHTAVAHTAAAHAAAVHTAATGARHAVIAGVAIDAATIGAAAFIRFYGGQVDELAAKMKRRLSPDELRKLRDSSYQKVQDAMRRAFTPAEEAELKLIYARLGIAAA
jgi:hypothetical protein